MFIKSFILNNFFVSSGSDSLFMTETWLRYNEVSSLIELCPPDCDFLSSPRTTGQGGGLAVLFRKQFYCRSIYVAQFSSFELQMLKVGSDKPLHCILIYCPPGYNSNFLTEISEFLSSTLITLDRALILGDFNIHIDDQADKFASEFLKTTECFNLSQHVSSPTHNRGHTLDLVFTFGFTLNSLCSEDILVSNHKGILFHFDFSIEKRINK